MTAKSADSWKKLGIARVTDEGELKLVYGIPKAKDIITLREGALRDALPGVRMVSINSFDRKTCFETLISHATYADTGGTLHVSWLGTRYAHKRRGAASALLAYLKTKRMPVELASNIESIKFYGKMGFEKVPKSLMVRLPAEKPLPKREFEGEKRKFVIFPKRR